MTAQSKPVQPADARFNVPARPAQSVVNVKPVALQELEQRPARLALKRIELILNPLEFRFANLDCHTASPFLSIRADTRMLRVTSDKTRDSLGSAASLSPAASTPD